MASNTDGVYTRSDRRGYWVPSVDAKARRKRRMTHAGTMEVRNGNL